LIFVGGGRRAERRPVRFLPGPHAHCRAVLWLALP
jgi:hypothetical protein